MPVFSFTIDEIDNVSNEILSKYKDIRHFAFYGKMGAGKTTVIKSFCHILNTEDAVVSPTFSIVNEYKTKDNLNIYHFDFFRIKNTNELFDIGLEEYFQNEGYFFYEWPELAEHLITGNRLNIYIEENNDERILKIK